MTFFKNLHKDTGCQKSQKSCYSQETFENDRFWSSFSYIRAKNTIKGSPKVNLTTVTVKS